MERKLKKSLAIMLSAVMIVASVPLGGLVGVDTSSWFDVIEVSAEGTVKASGVCGTNLTWSLDTEGVLTFSGTGAMTNYSSINTPWKEYKSSVNTVIFEDGVTSIGTYAFTSCGNLRSVTIPNSVTSIGDYAFLNCYVLESIIFPNSVETIGIYVFSNCYKLKSVTIPSSVKSIGENVLYNCYSITNINVDQENEYFSSVDGVLFNKDQTELLRYTSGAATEHYEIPNTVTKIKTYSFCLSKNLKSITIPASVKEIEVAAIYNCEELASINVEENSEYYCSVDGVLLNKDKTELLQCPSGIELENYAVPDSVTNIWELAFYACRTLKNITMSDSVQTIEERAFLECTGLTSITLSNSLEKIDEDVLGSCYALKSIVIPASVTTLVRSSFSYGLSLQTVTISDSLKSIELNAFDTCPNIKTVYYLGSEEQWNEISIDSRGNETLTDAEIIFNHVCEYTEVAAKDPTCSEDGYITYTCECGKTYTEVTPATGEHVDADGDGICDVCENEIEDSSESGDSGDTGDTSNSISEMFKNFVSILQRIIKAISDFIANIGNLT